jgi:carboxylesterase type B
MHAGSELVNVFDLSVALWGEGEEQLANTFVSYWTNFAKTGNPNSAGFPEWLTYGGSNGDVIAQLDAGNSTWANVTMVTGLKNGVCTLWNNMTIPATTIWG